MRILFPILFLLALTACKYDESISGYTESSAVWTLQELDGKPFPAHATLSFPDKGKVTGHGPCNTFFAAQKVPLPWIQIEAIGATKMACPDLAAEGVYFSALTEMTLAETLGNTLILSNDTGREMVFKSKN